MSKVKRYNIKLIVLSLILKNKCYLGLKGFVIVFWQPSSWIILLLLDVGTALLVQINLYFKPKNIFL